MSSSAIKPAVATKDVTTTTISDRNKVPRVEKVVFDNRIKRKNVLALNEKVAAIREYEKRPVYKRIGRMFQCSPDQIKRIVQHKDTILHAWEQRTRKFQNAKTLEMKVVKVSMLGKAVYEWIRRMIYYKDILITDGLIQKMALQFKSAMGLQNFFPHPEWCDKFRATYNIKSCDSKLLNIAYTQGYSVQIKDVMKDVLSECSPEHDEDADDDDDGDDEDDGDAYGEDDGDDEADGSNSKQNDCMIVETNNNNNSRMTLQNVQNHQSNEISTTVTNTPPTSSVYLQSPALQNLRRQLVALPMQTNGMPGLTQKVLVATPIGQSPGNAPMTMTIIPLASLAQSPITHGTTPTIISKKDSISLSSLFQQQQQQQQQQQPLQQQQHDDISVPSPMLEIKKEIKEEPTDGVEEFQSTLPVKPVIQIKKECITDDEEDEVTQNENMLKRKSMESTTAELLSAVNHVVAIPIANKDMLEDSTNDSLDDLTLSSLRKRIKREEPPRGDKMTTAVTKAQILQNTQQQTELLCKILPMPTLTKAPTAVVNSTTSADKPSTSSNEQFKLPPQQQQADTVSDLPPIKTYAEARRYLKLLEDFALERENFRLIGLITRSDEVLRELDRKEQHEDEDVDID